MKIQIVKQASGKAKIPGVCPYIIEYPPDAAKK